MPAEVFQFTDLCPSTAAWMIGIIQVETGYSIYEYSIIPQTAIVKGNEEESTELQNLVIACCDYYTTNSRDPLDVEDKLPII